VKRSEIWWAEMPESIGRRPVVLLSRDEILPFRSKVVVAEITTKARGRLTEVTVGKTEGLSVRSVIVPENLHTIPKDWLTERMGALSGAKVRALNEALRFSLELD
jgi:mRNA interferase MazF